MTKRRESKDDAAIKLLRKALRRALSMQTGGMFNHMTAPPSMARRCSCPACVRDFIRRALRETK